MENKSSKEEKESTPTIDLKLETKEIKGGMIYCPYILIETPYMIISDMNGSRKVWTKNKKKIILYYLLAHCIFLEDDSRPTQITRSLSFPPSQKDSCINAAV